MAKNPVGFEITNTATGWDGADFDDVFVRKDCFLEGGLWLWGNNGILGNNNQDNPSSPVQTISGGTNWKSIDQTGIVTSAAIKTDGTLWMWGDGAYGTLGNGLSGATVNRSSPVQTVSGGTNWKSISNGWFHTAAIKTDGSLWLWGYGGTGALGDNTRINRSSPVQTISRGTNWKSVSAYMNTIGIKTDGTLWIWGDGISFGNVGDGLRDRRSSPVQTISQGTNWKQASTGNWFNAATKTDGTLWLWGISSNGQLGQGSGIHRSSPVQTSSGGTNWKQVSVACRTAAAIKTDGTLWVWGNNYCGRLGINDGIILNSFTPIQTVSGGTNWRTVSLGSYQSAAIKTDGTLWVWGGNNYGGLGDNTIISRSSPVQTISGGTNWKSIQTKFWSSAAIREDCW